MTITVDPGDPTPVFEQIQQQVIAQRDAGELPAGHRLPPVRRLAGELGLAANTVALVRQALDGGSRPGNPPD